MTAMVGRGAIAGTAWDRAYEAKAVTLMALGFGIVGLDRFIINPLFPIIQKDLGLSYQDLGVISAVLALTWGVAALFTGQLLDRIGRKKVIVPAVLIFSVLVGVTGLGTGLGSLLLIRGLMGLPEGAYVPASIVVTIEASKPSRTGLNIGIQQMANPLIGLGLGPIFAVGLLKLLPSWHWVFGAAALPGLVLALLMMVVLREHGPSLTVKAAETSILDTWRHLLGYRNVVCNTLGMFCYLSCAMTLSAFMPSYLTDHLGLPLSQMGGVLAGLGVGSCLGMVALPAISDRLGRKSVMLSALAVLSVVLLWLPTIGAEPGKLFWALFLATFMLAGVIAINVGPLTSSSVPPHLAATATGAVVGLGEIFGGALAPALAGGIAQAFGITIIPVVALVAAVVGLVILAFGVQEPAGASRAALVPH